METKCNGNLPKSLLIQAPLLIILGYQKGQILEYGIWESVFSMFSKKKKNGKKYEEKIWKKIWKNVFSLFFRGGLPSADSRAGSPLYLKRKKFEWKKVFFDFFSIFFFEAENIRPGLSRALLLEKSTDWKPLFWNSLGCDMPWIKKLYCT